MQATRDAHFQWMFKFLTQNDMALELERRLSRSKHLLLLLKTPVWFQTPTGQLTPSIIFQET